jgi:hypothetical protein
LISTVVASVLAEEVSAASADGISASPLAAVALNAIKCRRFILLFNCGFVYS